MNIKSLGISFAVVSVLSLSFTGCGGEENSKDSGSGTTPQTLQKSYIKFIGTDKRDFASASAYDSQNNLFVAGTTQGRIMDYSSVNAGGYDMYLRKLDSNGNTLCTFQYGTSEDDLTAGIVVDSDDNVYVAGTTSRDFDGQTANGSTDIFLMKFNSSCEKQKTILIGSAEAEKATGLSMDQENNIYLTGWSRGSINSQPKKGDSYADWIILKLNTDLTTIWTTQDGSDGDDWTEDIAVDNNGSLFVVGSLDNNIDGFTDVQGGEDAFVAKYNTGDGSRTWIQNFGASNDSGGTDVATSVDVTSAGDAVVGFRVVSGDNSGVAYYNQNGSQKWKVTTEYYSYITVGVGENDTIYSADNTGSYSTGIRKHNNQTGDVLWTEVLDPIWSRGYAWIEDFTLNPNDGYMYGTGASEDNFQDPYGADNNHSGSYDGFVIKFK
jgi:hypothetical protein